MNSYEWDFVGPRSSPIAQHHARHVREFLLREGLEGCEVGVTVHSPIKATAWCRAPDGPGVSIVRALRPPRVIDRSSAV